MFILYAGIVCAIINKVRHVMSVKCGDGVYVV